MFRNYIITAFRNFWRNKIFSLINILGLAIGISAALVIYLIVHYDFSFEKFQRDGDRIYRVVSDMKFADDEFKISGVPFPLAEAVKKEVRGIEESSAFYTYGGTVTIPAGNGKPRAFKNQTQLVLVDDHYFKLFSFYNWLAGSAETSLKDPFQVVLAESRAKTYFPGSDPRSIIGSQVVYNDSIRTTIVGIVKDPSEITDFNFKEFISHSTIANSNLKKEVGFESWGGINSANQFFLKLSKAVTPAHIEERIQLLRKKYDKQENKNDVKHRLQALNDIHFNNYYDNFDQRIASRKTLLGLAAVGIFLLLLGCMNFINLATAQAVNRAKEIGIRKTVGSSKTQLVIQFLSETLLLTLTATTLSIAITPWLLHIFSDFIPAGLKYDLLEQPHLILFLVLLILAVTIMSGFYPAMVLSGFQPVLVLKNQGYANTGKTRKVRLRKILTVCQFVIAQVFIMSTLIVVKQIHYSLNKDLGYRKDAIITIPTPFNFSGKDERRFVMMNKLKRIPEIESVSLAGPPPASFGMSTMIIKFKNGKSSIETDVQMKTGDTAYIPLYKLKLLAGKNLQQSDTTREYVINHTYAKSLGFQNPYDAIGQHLGESNKIPIVGVVSDFHQRSMREQIKPIAISCETNSQFTLHIALKPQNAAGTLWGSAFNKMQTVWKELYPEEDFQYQFYDESIARFYKSDQDILRLLKWATGLVILISSLGLLGLVIYTTNSRTKEIGVRKVLGASVSQIISSLSMDFMKLIVIAFVISVPLAWWAMNQWLENFAYRTSISWWIFFATGLTIILTAFITMGYQTTRAALANPVKSLRTE